MPNELLIESGPHETRVALLEEGRVVEVHIERATEPGLVGSIYRGRVSRVVPGIQAAFVDLGLDRDAFLFAGDLQRSGDAASTANGQTEESPPLQPSISELVHQGQEMLVQVVKEPLPGKGARISTQLSLPGPLVVLLPGATGVGISRRISTPDERRRLEESLSEMVPEGCGVIARTAAEGRTSKDLHRDLDRLQCQWEQIQRRAAGVRVPGRVHEEASLALRAARDLLSGDIAEVWLEGSLDRESLIEALENLEPSLVERIRIHRAEEPLFARRGVDAAISRAMRSRVWLDSGGFIVINPTEALVAIDVNSGRHTEASALEATALETNLEAAVEVARQIRLRDLAGIIVVDFIDMIEPRNRAAVTTRFEEAMARDRTRAQISQMSDFGLVAVTRKRMRGSLGQNLTEICPCCDGEGRIKDAVTVGLELARELRRRGSGFEKTPIAVRLHPRTARVLAESHPQLLTAIEDGAGGALEIRGDERLGLEEFEIETVRDLGHDA
jgi:ribonuclease G